MQLIREIILALHIKARFVGISLTNPQTEVIFRRSIHVETTGIYLSVNSDSDVSQGLSRKIHG